MTREARQTQKRLEGEILKPLEGKSARLKTTRGECEFCLKYDRTPDCEECPLEKSYPGDACTHKDFRNIYFNMIDVEDDAIPGALAIYMWLEEL